ncbi:MAG: PIN domain-containing protein [Bacteroidales bacterium]|nr:PIN domain-containing protein [Bacteroidales bacterium]
MKVFIDTNIFAEYIFDRAQSTTVQKLFQTIKDGKIEAITSTASIYTMTYISEQMLKLKGIHRPELTEQIRKIIDSLLLLVHIGNLEHSDMMDAANDLSFSDIEDAFQYHCALKNQCNFLITINIKDFSQANQELMKAITPNEFASSYLV